MDTIKEANQRFDDFFKEIKKTRSIWVLKNDDGYANYSDEDANILPAWSHKSQAQNAMQHYYQDYKMEKVGLEFFCLELLPLLAEKDIWIGINLTKDMTGIDMPPAEFKNRMSGLIEFSDED